VWYSDDHARTWKVSTNGTTGQALQLLGLDEPALAETPSGGVTVRARNMNLFHGEEKCNCRGKADSSNGGTSFEGHVGFDSGLPSPVCQGTMINDGPGIIYSSMPGYGTPTEKKDAHDGRGNGIVRWSTDGGNSWLGNVSLWHGQAYSYSCLSHVPAEGYIGLAWETVLPDSGPHKRDISANNVLFTLIPTQTQAQMQAQAQAQAQVRAQVQAQAKMQAQMAREAETATAAGRQSPSMLTSGATVAITADAGKPANKS
jgi:hypothetical protein